MALLSAIAYGWRQLVSRRVYLVMMLVVPVIGAFFFYNLMEEGLPMRVPVAIVDLDQSALSRKIGRTLDASQMVEVSVKAESFDHALDLVRSGKVFGFFLIPPDFEHDAIGGRQTVISFYSNMTYFIPGTLSFKGFKTQSVTTAGGLALTKLTAAGVPEAAAGELINPVSIDIRAPGNPWMNYNIYLTNSFVPGLLALLVALVTAYSILVEVKDTTSIEWMRRSGGSILTAVIGKLLVQFAVWAVVGMAMLGYLYGIAGFPLNCPVWHMVAAMLLLIMASQWYAVAWCCMIPNLRMAVSMCSLTGILAFSIAAFSFPVDQMYGAIGIFSYILPVRYYFLIYIDQALNGIPLYYSRWYYAALMLFPLAGMLGLSRLRRRCLNPVYVP